MEQIQDNGKNSLKKMILESKNNETRIKPFHTKSIPSNPIERSST